MFRIPTNLAPHTNSWYIDMHTRTVSIGFPSNPPPLPSHHPQNISILFQNHLLIELWCSIIAIFECAYCNFMLIINLYLFIWNQKIKFFVVRLNCSWWRDDISLFCYFNPINVTCISLELIGAYSHRHEIISVNQHNTRVSVFS